MSQLENRFLWSHSRQSSFDHCLREFYWKVWGGWGGWEEGADERARLCYRLSKMDTLDTWAGDIVHGALAQTLRRIGDFRGLPVPVDEIRQDAENHVINRLREGWKQSVGKKWQRSPKWNLNLFEHYYGLEIPRSRTDQVKARVMTCLDAFFQSGFFRKLVSGEYPKVVGIEEMKFFEVRGHRICVVIDLAAETREGSLEIWDWKTGGVRGKDTEQAAVYALAAHRIWGYEPDRISASVLYLQSGSIESSRFRAEDLSRTEERILEGCRAMKARIADPEAHRARIEDFPMAEQRWKCRTCAFYEACYATRQIEAAS